MVFKVLGKTIDDAAGEALDKGGKLLGLEYPAGRKIDELAKKGNPHAYSFPIGLKNKPTTNLSYSGVKTSLRLFIEKNPEVLTNKDQYHDVVASYQWCVMEALMTKLKLVKKSYPKLPVVIGGGVASNSLLRSRLKKEYDNTYMVAPQYCTDNGAMIAHHASRIEEQWIPFPECLKLDARARQ